MQLFSADAIVFLKKIDPENMKQLPSKVAHNPPPTLQCTGQLPKRPRNRNPVPPKAP